jgi:PadR family transcriptional regulator, regulatory protein PadR
MPTRKEESERIALLQGTLDLLILKVLQLVPVHGQGIARAILRQSDEAFFVDHGSLYLALQRLEDNGLITAEWASRRTIERRASTRSRGRATSG